ncbi:MAG: hypothetical protein IKO52_04115 [Clostridia bacterium]|nr:hypothetical protein [Clostridia bacterium]
MVSKIAPSLLIKENTEKDAKHVLYTERPGAPPAKESREAEKRATGTKKCLPQTVLSVIIEMAKKPPSQT